MHFTCRPVRSFGLAHGLSLELFLRSLDDLVEHLDLYLAHLLLVAFLDDLVDFSESFAETGEEVVFDAVVGPGLGRATCLRRAAG